MKSNQNGKGDKQRHTNKKQYDTNFLFIDWGNSKSKNKKNEDYESDELSEKQKKK